MLQQMENGHNCTRNRLKLANAMHTCRPQGNEKRKLQVCLLKLLDIYIAFPPKGYHMYLPYYIPCLDYKLAMTLPCSEIIEIVK